MFDIFSGCYYKEHGTPSSVVLFGQPFGQAVIALFIGVVDKSQVLPLTLATKPMLF